MSNKLTPITRRELIKRLARLGFTGPYPGKKHNHMVRNDIFVIIPNPHHNEKISVKLQLIILREAGVSREEWLSAE